MRFVVGLRFVPIPQINLVNSIVTVIVLCILAAVQTVTVAFPTNAPENWSSVRRSLTTPDNVYLSSCQQSCQIFAGMNPKQTTNTTCLCQCNRHTPTFLPSKKSCISRLDECWQQIRFEHNDPYSSWIPAFSLPSTNDIFAPSNKIAWKEAKIQLLSNGSVNCTISNVFIQSDGPWSNKTNARLFKFQLYNATTFLQWMGDEMDAQALEGSVVQLKLTCSKYVQSAYCLAFRIAGIQVNNQSFYRLTEREWSQIELIVCFLLAILLILTIFGSVILWSVCWRIKKGKLIAQIQTQFLFHLKQQQIFMEEQIAAIRANYARQVERTIEEQIQSEYPVKRRLYFNAEFLDPEIMANPPPVAQQFIVELRKMIGMAKEKIRLKRHTPTLDSIQEEECEDEYQLHFPLPGNSIKQKIDGSSPKSVKSSDSGVGSLSDEDAKGEQKAVELSSLAKFPLSSIITSEQTLSAEATSEPDTRQYYNTSITTAVDNSTDSSSDDKLAHRSNFGWKNVRNNNNEINNKNSDSGNDNNNNNSKINNNNSDSIIKNDTNSYNNDNDNNNNSNSDNNNGDNNDNGDNNNNNNSNNNSNNKDYSESSDSNLQSYITDSGNSDSIKKAKSKKGSNDIRTKSVVNEPIKVSSNKSVECNDSSNGSPESSPTRTTTTTSTTPQPSRLPVFGHRGITSNVLARSTAIGKPLADRLKKLSPSEPSSNNTGAVDTNTGTKFAKTTAAAAAAAAANSPSVTRIPTATKIRPNIPETLSVVPPPLPVSPPPQLPSTTVQDKIKNFKRSTYAVFPSETMLKKSLPRRIRRPTQLQQFLNASKTLETSTT